MIDETQNIQKQTSEAIDELLQLVSFRIADEEFGVDIIKVQEIIRMVDITRVPNTPHYVIGVINLRGKVIPIIDMRRRLNLKETPYTKDTRIVVVEEENKIVGFIVDSVSEVLRISSSVLEPPPPMVSGISSDFITSIAKLEGRLLILLDLEKVLAKDDVKEDEE
jgi:purine-binding chemotaxis protein CheW